MVFNVTFNNISAILWHKKPEYPEKTIEYIIQQADLI